MFDMILMIYFVKTCTIISSMARILDGGMLPIFLHTLSIEEENIEWERIIKGHEKSLEQFYKTQQDL